jgi:hypothetical protein
MPITTAQYEQMRARVAQNIARQLVGIYENHRETQSPVAKRAVRHEPVAAAAGKNNHPNRICIRITGFRRRLLDPDNFCPKYFIDCLRYAEIIQDDSPEFITLETSQVKVKNTADERTEITVVRSLSEFLEKIK